ncbi:MaoC family dehydratase N-terminal domain-containing protein [Chloroflexota bacterium]
MPEDSLITEELKQLVGQNSETLTFSVDKQWVRRFAEAIDYPEPVWQEEYSQNANYDGVVVPPTFLCALRNDNLRKKLHDMPHPLRTMVNGSSELVFNKPVRVGDEISVTDTLVNVTVQERKKGKMLVLTNQVSYTNQHGEVVALGHNTALRF